MDSKSHNKSKKLTGTPEEAADTIITDMQLHNPEGNVPEGLRDFLINTLSRSKGEHQHGRVTYFNSETQESTESIMHSGTETIQ